MLQARSGAGPVPAPLRISHTVGAAAFIPGTSSSPYPLPTQLALQHGDLVAQHQDLGVFVPIACRKKTHERERVRHRQVGESQQHSRSSCRDDHHDAAVPGCTRATKPPDLRPPNLMPLTRTDEVFGNRRIWEVPTAAPCGRTAAAP